MVWNLFLEERSRVSNSMPFDVVTSSDTAVEQLCPFFFFRMSLGEWRFEKSEKKDLIDISTGTWGKR
jgi:hypothetical protein